MNGLFCEQGLHPFTDQFFSAAGSSFNVEIGPPATLSFLRHSQGGWAGNQPFATQPKLALLDLGGNIVVGDSESIVTAHVTPSISQNSRVVINTANDDIPIIIQVAFAPSIRDDERVYFGPGDTIVIDVIFSQEVTLLPTDDAGVLPQLALNVFGPEAVYSELIPQSPEGSYTRTLSFRYDVKVGQSQVELDYPTIDAVRCNSFDVVDAFGRSADMILPASGSSTSLSASKSIGISDSPPTIESIAVDLPAGEYGAGEEVDFIVTFDRYVAVTGHPGLPLNIQSSILVIEILSENERPSFFNILYRGKRSRRIPSNASAFEIEVALTSLLSVGGKVCVSRSPSLSAIGFRWAIRFMSVNDFIQDVRVDDSELAISITTTILTTNSALLDWSVDDGDTTMCTTRAASYVDGSGTKTLRFSFITLQGDNADLLGIHDIVEANLLYSNIEDSVFLMTNSFGIAAIQVDPKLDEFTVQNHVAIKTSPPVVMSITPQESSTPDGTYAVGDTLFFEVIFDKPVEVSCTQSILYNFYSGSDCICLLLS